MTLPQALAILNLVVAVPLNWVIAATLVSLARSSSDVPVLRAAAVSWVSLAIIVTVFAAVFLNNGMEKPVLDGVQTQVLTRGTLLLFSVIPAAFWLRIVWRRR